MSLTRSSAGPWQRVKTFVQLTNASTPHKHDRLLQANHEIQEKPQRGGFSCRDKQAGHGHARVIVNVCDQVCPRRELARLEVDKVVVDGSLARDLDCRPGALPPLVKVLPAAGGLALSSRQKCKQTLQGAQPQAALANAFAFFWGSTGVASCRL